MRIQVLPERTHFDLEVLVTGIRPDEDLDDVLFPKTLYGLLLAPLGIDIQFIEPAAIVEENGFLVPCRLDLGQVLPLRIPFP